MCFAFGTENQHLVCKVVVCLLLTNQGRWSTAFPSLWKQLIYCGFGLTKCTLFLSPLLPGETQIKLKCSSYA